MAQRQAEEAHEREPVFGQIFRAPVRERVHGLKDQDLEHEHGIERRPTTLRAAGARHGRFQCRPEHLEIDHRVQALQIVAFGRKLLQTLIKIENPGIPAPVITPTKQNQGNHGRLKNARIFEGAIL